MVGASNLTEAHILECSYVCIQITVFVTRAAHAQVQSGMYVCSTYGRATKSMRPTMSVVEIPSVRGIVKYFPKKKIIEKFLIDT